MEPLTGISFSGIYLLLTLSLIFVFVLSSKLYLIEKRLHDIEFEVRKLEAEIKGLRKD